MSLPTHIWFSKYKMGLEETACSMEPRHNPHRTVLTYNYIAVILKAEETLAAALIRRNDF